MYTFVRSPRISKKSFAQILAEHDSPVAPIADECYDIIVEYGLDPAVALAFFQQDSAFGTQGEEVDGHNTLENKNWGNRRGNRNGVGGYQKFETWQDGLRFWCESYFREHAWLGRLTVEQVVPYYTNVNPEAYIAAVNEAIARWQDMPDAPAIATYFHSPNYWPGRGGHPINAIVLHATAGPFTPSLQWLVKAGSQVSAHFLIAKEGAIFQLVDVADRAWHAGRSYWRGWTNLNHNSIGIEMVNANDGVDPYPPEQVEALLWLCRRLVNEYGIEREMVTTHALIAPHRKTDPKGFPLEEFLDKLYAPTVSLKEALTQAAWEALEVPYDAKSPFLREATRLKLGAPLSPEKEVVVEGRTYVLQVFALDTLYCLKGDWENIKRLSKLKK